MVRIVCYSEYSMDCIVYALSFLSKNYLIERQDFFSYSCHIEHFDFSHWFLFKCSVSICLLSLLFHRRLSSICVCTWTDPEEICLTAKTSLKTFNSALLSFGFPILQFYYMVSRYTVQFVQFLSFQRLPKSIGTH